MFPPAPEEHLKVLNDLQRLHYYVKNMQNKMAIDKVRDIVEKIQANYGYTSAQPIRDALELLEEGRYNDERIDILFGIQPNVLDEYLVSMSEYRDDHSILNDGWH
jgi:K+ transporter